jgi:hypothetical protein
MATKSNSASCTNENISLFLSCYRFSVFYGSATASKYHNNQQRHPTSKPMNSAFYYYHQWEQKQLSLWEQEQELADKQDMFDELSEFEDFEDFE